jgi:hypothetical protein
MLWLLAVVVLVLVAPRLARRRRDLVPIFPWESISTLHTDRSKKTSDATRAALAAATQLLRK